MATMTISLPDDISDYVEAQVGEDFADTGEFLAELVRRDQEQRMSDLRSRIEQSIASGVSERSFDERIAEGDRILRQRGLLDG